MFVDSFKAKRVFKVMGLLLIFIVFLLRDGFDSSTAVIKFETPNSVQTAALESASDSNPVIEGYLKDVQKEIRRACWKSGWRQIVSTVLFAAPDKAEVTVTDFLGTRTEIFHCSNF
jgi:hypothetical protein